MNKLKFSLEPTGTLSERDAKRYFSVFGFAVFALVTGLQVGGFLLSNLLHRFAPWVFGHAVVYQLISLIPLYGIGLPLCYWILCLLPRDGVTPEKMDGKSVVKGFCAAVSLTMDISSSRLASSDARISFRIVCKGRNWRLFR